MKVLYETPSRTHILRGRVSFEKIATAVVAIEKTNADIEIALASFCGNKCLFYAKAERRDAEMLANAAICVFTQIGEVSSETLRVALIVAGDDATLNDPSLKDTKKYLDSERSAELALEKMLKTSTMEEIITRIDKGLASISSHEKYCQQLNNSSSNQLAFQ